MENQESKIWTPYITNLTGGPFKGVYAIFDRFVLFAGYATGNITLASSVLSPPEPLKLRNVNSADQILYHTILEVNNNGTGTTVLQSNDGTFNLPNATITGGKYSFFGKLVLH